MFAKHTHTPIQKENIVLKLLSYMMHILFFSIPLEAFTKYLLCAKYMA